VVISINSFTNDNNLLFSIDFVSGKFLISLNQYFWKKAPLVPLRRFEVIKCCKFEFSIAQVEFSMLQESSIILND